VARWIRWTTRLAIYHRDGFKCVWCGFGVGKRTKRFIELDHVIPRSEYAGHGANGHWNLVTSCKHCNARRGNLSVGEWLSSMEPLQQSAALLRFVTAMGTPINRTIGRRLCREKFRRLV
jgi:5-methylcytosine-specific restriction endonuclease McrA